MTKGSHRLLNLILAGNLLLNSSCDLFAQVTGIHFEHGISWQEVLKKAKKDNKHIFVDCYTTWCGPCKMMSSQVFPLESVGKFYNANYINVKLQIDSTQNDNPEIQAWYTTANQIAHDYYVMAYPTYLFFDSD